MGNRLGLVLYCLRRAGEESAGVSTDRQLLESFLGQRDEPAFAALVQRHGPMVLGVCRRLLDDLDDVDDAFQATFLVLIRRARSMAWQDSLGGWLHQVARRVAQRARIVRTRRRASERETDAMQIIDRRSPDIEQQDLRRLLDEELDRLSCRYRDPLVLCHLEGKTHEEAALELGCPRGSMDRLLTQAEERLRDRLVGRGLALPAAVAAVLAAEQSAAAAVPAPLIEATIRCAALTAAGQAGVSNSVVSLTEGVIHTMMLNKVVKIAMTAALVAGLLAGGLGLFWPAGRAADAVEGVQAAADNPKPPVIRPYVVWSGPHSQVRETGYRRIISAEDWRNLWQVHRAGEAPQIDFEQCMVVAIYQGATQNCKGIKVVSVQDEKDQLKVRFAGEWYQTGEPGDAVTPYGLFLLPNSAKPLVLEENTGPLGGQPAVWKLRAQFDPPGATAKESAPIVARPPVDRSAQAITQRLKNMPKEGKNTALEMTVREGVAVLFEKEAEMPVEFLAPAPGQAAENQFKNQLQAVQMRIALQQYKMSVVHDELEALRDMLAKEPKDWQIHYQYVQAQLLARMARLYEYNAQLGKMRQELPPRDPEKDKGWRLVVAGNYSDREASLYAKRARDYYTLLGQVNIGNWKEIATAEANDIAKGLMWEPWPR